MCERQDFSVLMSLYVKEKADYFDECMKSILNQTVLPSEIVIVLDGPITDELRKVLNYYLEKNPSLYKVVDNKVNKGLGPALAEGIKHCSNTLVARMDTDDISRSDRFELQLREFIENPKLDICGSHIIEFDKSIKNVLAKRLVPLTHNKIIEYQKRRSAFNHMTVMYKKTTVLKAGNYQDAPLMEDDVLWVNMIQKGAICKNIDDYLVYARTGIAMIGRRGGWDYLKKYQKGRKKILETGYIGLFDYYITLVIQFIIAIIPSNLRLLAFKYILR